GAAGRPCLGRQPPAAPVPGGRPADEGRPWSGADGARPAGAAGAAVAAAPVRPAGPLAAGGGAGGAAGPGGGGPGAPGGLLPAAGAGPAAWPAYRLGGARPRLPGPRPDPRRGRRLVRPGGRVARRGPGAGGGRGDVGGRAAGGPPAVPAGRPPDGGGGDAR